MTISIDLTDPTVSDEELDSFRVAVLNEQERRARLAQFPQQVAQDARRFVADGGKLSDVTDALAEVTDA